MAFMMFPGYPGPVNPRQRGGIGQVATPALPATPLHPGGQQVGGPHPLAGLASYGVPIGLSPTGQPIIQTGMGPGMAPPEFAGMPMMPSPAPGGGLFQPMTPVAPFDHGNQVRSLHQQAQTPPA